jgi:release factor glutamine methyltransferase
MQSSPASNLIKEGQTLLERHGVPNALHNAEWMLSHLLECTRAELYLAAAAVDQRVVDRFEEYIVRRCAREPLQYILKSVEFMSYPFAAVPGVFIPRFETELLVERAEQHLAARGIREGAVLDLCSGSGVIALSLALRNRDLKAIGVDFNPEAVDVSDRNAETHGIGDRVRFEMRNARTFLVDCEMQFDLIVSNPPYIRTGEMTDLPPEVREFEPVESLCGGPDGLEFYREVMPILPRAMTKRGVAAFEIGAEQGDAVSDLMRAAGLESVTVYKDYAEHDRVVIGHAR